VSLTLLAPPPAQAEHPNHAQGFRPEHTFDFSGIENVNLFNRNLTLTIPIGPAYPVGPDFSYQLMLTYTGNVWDWDEETDDMSGDTYLQALLRYRSNAGLGWELSLGRIQAGADPSNTSDGPVYESPDQSLHPLENGPLHVGGQTFPGVYFSRDSTYLRYTLSTSTLEFPDGLERTFGSDGLSKIQDPFGNKLEITYTNRDADGDPLTWTLKDNHGRQHTIHFGKKAVADGKDLEHYRLVVTSVELEAFDGTNATYTFSYKDSKSFYRACNAPQTCGTSPDINDCGDTSNVSYPVLTQVLLPDGSSYTMQESDYRNVDASLCQDRLLNGHLTRLGLPTGGAFEWSWANVQFPAESRNIGPPRFTGGKQSPFRQAAGIALREHLDSSNNVVGTWSYSSAMDGTADCTNCEQQTAVTDPAGNTTTNYFSVDACMSETSSTNCSTDEDWSYLEYGLPFTRRKSDGDGRFLSREVRDSGNTLLRSVYVGYENSGLNYNPRMASEKTVYEQDQSGTRYKAMKLTDFDGLGHYRVEEDSGNFPGANDRTTTTTYNPGRSMTSIPGETDPWILNTFTTQNVTETRGSDTWTATREYCFDPATGFLERTRSWKGGARSGDDVVVTRQDQLDANGKHVGGFVLHERYYGGDGASLGTTGDLCTMGLPSKADYGQDHTYSCGVLATSQWTDATFLSTDRIIDCLTGLVKASRDPAFRNANGTALSEKTTYSYDDLGRLTKVDPPLGEASTVYIYSRYMPPGSANPGLAKVAIQRKIGSAVYAGKQYKFDGLGRVVDEQRGLPGGSTAERETTWSGRDLMASQSTWHTKGTPAADKTYTVYGSYDPFGRPGSITLPDGHQVSLSYRGESRRGITVQVGTGIDAGGTVTETPSTTYEYSDRFGRLTEVHEGLDPSDPPTTRYTYDAQDHLVKVHQNVLGTTSQTRTFTYDGRGFLGQETHPELGTAVDYSDYDPLGNPGHIQRGGWNLCYGYDFAGRLVDIHEIDATAAECSTSPVLREWKQWTYATDNNQAGTYSNGKLQSMKRHNWVKGPPDTHGNRGSFDPWVEESYTYDGVGGAVSNVQTVIATGDPAAGDRPTFDYSIQYTPLGDIASRTYPRCSHKYCTDLTQQYRTVTQSFDHGFLTGISGFAPSIQYHPNGMVSKVDHGNGVSWLQELDPAGMGRPYRIRTTGASENFNTGAYAYL